MFNLVALIKAAGYLGVAAMVFAESGLLIGVVFPGDSLLFTAGFLASQGYLNIYILVAVTFLSAVLGDNLGYWFGKKFGRSVFSKKGSLLLDPSHIEKAESYYKKFGAKTILIARFIPVVRTIAPVLAGVGSMDRKAFVSWNVAGGFLWAVGVTVTGYVLGQSIPNIDQYLLPIIALIIFISILPGIWHILSDKEYRQRLWRVIKK